MDYFWGNWKSLVEEIENNNKYEQNLSNAIQWYENEAFSKYGCQPQWHQLFTCLLHKEPAIENGGLTLIPVFHHLSLRLQTTFLQLLVHFRHRILVSELLPFVREISQRTSECEDTWSDVYIRMLAAHCQASEKGELFKSKEVEGYVFTEENRQKAAVLCQQIGCVPVPADSQRTGEDSVELTEAVGVTERMESGGPVEDNVAVKQSLILEPCVLSEPMNTATQTSLIKMRECWQMECMDLPDEFSLFYTSTLDQVAEYCKILDFETLTESAVICASQHLLEVSDNMSHDNCVQFLQSALLTKLTENISRPLLCLLKKMGEEIPKPLIDGIFMKIITSRENCSSKTDLICKIMKESMQVKDLIHLVRKMNCMPQELVESHLSLYQTLVEMKIPLENDDLSKMLETLQRSSTKFTRNLKFGKLILAILHIFLDQMNKDQLSILHQVIQCHTSFLKKSIKSAIQKLQNHNEGFS